jgi:hypothetical protein
MTDSIENGWFMVILDIILLLAAKRSISFIKKKRHCIPLPIKSDEWNFVAWDSGKFLCRFNHDLSQFYQNVEHFLHTSLQATLWSPSRSRCIRNVSQSSNARLRLWFPLRRLRFRYWYSKIKQRIKNTVAPIQAVFCIFHSNVHFYISRINVLQ